MMVLSAKGMETPRHLGPCLLWTAMSLRSGPSRGGARTEILPCTGYSAGRDTAQNFMVLYGSFGAQSGRDWKRRILFYIRVYST